VLLEGEPGSGRTLIAKAIHASSRFAASPITVLDFRVPATERPSVNSIGQRSDTFTLLLERVDEATTAEMNALLALYERREEGVLDARIIATASSDLRRAGAEGRLRKELVAQVAAVRILVPPLRAHTEDIPLLVRQFAREICGAEPLFEPGDLDRMVDREYLGNVRELRQMIIKALQMEVTPPALPREGAARARAALVMPLNARPKPPSPKVARDRLVEWFERDWITTLHARFGGNLNELARETGVPRKELVKKLKDWKVQVSEK
jgi:DNA-binding NtrC family response regulator